MLMKALLNLKMYPFTLGCKGTPSSFSAFFLRETIFLTSCLLNWRMKSFQIGVCSLREEFALIGVNSFVYEMTAIYMEATMKMTELVPLKVYP